MASSSTLSTGQIWLYDVFVSFRGEDTRVNFVDRLHHALKQRRINVYQDEVMIDKWITFGDEHIRAIEQSRFYIIVFSKNYASSRCCMDELVKIMQCHEKKVHTAYSIFYDVKQTEIRKLTEEVGEAFSNHENAGKWREALKKAANLPGWESVYAHIWQVNLLIQKIVNMILQESYSNDSVFDGQMIGMETRVKDVVSYLEKDVNDVRMIGIKGMGGSGKTTLARAVYDIISFNFERKSFVENVREVSKASSNGLKSLQNQVLMDVLKMQGVRVSSVDGGKSLMKKVMCDRKVLLVLDDVDHIDQLEGLAGDLRWFMPGSRIIITTRDEQVLKVHRVNVILDVKLLSHKEAICLFSKYAFGEDIPIHGYEEFSAQVVRYAEGLPSTVRDAGSFLRGKDESEWINAIEKLKKKSMEETLEKRKISNIGLKEDYKENFPDAACLDKDFGHLKIPMKDIVSATNNFHSNNDIGGGGFGRVYKGELSLPEGQMIKVAFKRLDRRWGQGNTEFWKEIMMLSTYKHENLISLMYFSTERGDMILGYEYASRGSLERYLSNAGTLTWSQRLKICVGVARGLNFLHDPMGTQQRVIHRDIKSANILLDDNWKPKISDFGLSKIGPANQAQTYLVSNAVGTYGYCDPLYWETGVLSKESDVYSFGVVLFEILCGRLCCVYRNGQLTKILVPKWRQYYDEKRLDEIILTGLKEQMDPGSLNLFSAIAYQCVKRAREDRPIMADIVEQLHLALKQQG